VSEECCRHRGRASISLGPRLAKVAAFVPFGASLGDIGTDHAHLPVSLYERGQISRAVAVDVHHGPYLSALSTVRERGLEEAIAVRLGNGLEPIAPGEVDTLTIAGMGGSTMLEILDGRPDVLRTVTTIVVQPQGAEARVRKHLLAAGWFLAAEELVAEDGRIYAVIVFSTSEGLDLAGVDAAAHRLWERLGCAGVLQGGEEANPDPHPIWRYGPLILARPTELLRTLLGEDIRLLERRAQGLRRARDPEVRSKRDQIFHQIGLLKSLEEMLFCP